MKWLMVLLATCGLAMGSDTNYNVFPTTFTTGRVLQINHTFTNDLVRYKTDPQYRAEIGKSYLKRADDLLEENPMMVVFATELRAKGVRLLSDAVMMAFYQTNSLVNSGNNALARDIAGTSSNTNMIREWAKDGTICNVLGHKWDSWLDMGPHSGRAVNYRKCMVCDKEERLFQRTEWK